MADNESITRDLATLCANYTYCSIPREAIRMAELALLDFLGCMYRGAKEPLTEILVREYYDLALSIETLLPGHLPSAAPTNLAMVLGCAAHAIDYDDSHPIVKGHLGAPVIGAVLALARIHKFLNRQIITAIVAGYECATRVAQLITPDHYEKGFHTTATLGVYGAAGACANLLGLSVPQICQVFGLATTRVSGLKCTFGTMAKPFNAGSAAASGLMAASLVKKGFTAPIAAVEDSMGLLALYDGFTTPEPKLSPVSEYLILGNMFKIYASCHFTHPCIEGIKRYCEEISIVVDDIERLELKVSTIAIKTAYIVDPDSGLACKFSFPQIAAMVLCGLDLSDDSVFVDEILNDKEINRVRNKICVDIDEQLSPGCISFELNLKNDTVHSWQYNYLDYQTSDKDDSEDLENKFIANVSSAFDETFAKALLADVLTIRYGSETFNL
jgi:2-methylcitrate dehydratase PrpD